MSDEKSAKPRAVKPGATAAGEPAAEALPAPPAVSTLPAPAAEQARTADDKLLKACHVAAASIGAAQSAVASDVTAMALEVNGMAHAGFAAAGDSVAALFRARSLADAVEIQLGLARRSLDTFVGGSARLGELGLRLANDAAKPVMAPFGG